MDCSHLKDNVKVDYECILEETSITKNLECAECLASEQTWLCLWCGLVGCGRYLRAHAKLHADTAHHPLTISCHAYSVYCYKCDEFVINDSENELIGKIREKLMKYVEREQGRGEEGSVSEGALAGDSAPALPSGGDAAFLAASQPSLRRSPSKEEVGRCLRPRSRKRTLSAHSDTSSVENHADTPAPAPAKHRDRRAHNGKTLKEKKVVGLKNLGNTCFMNAVLQSLSNIQEFSCYFSRLPSLEAADGERDGDARKVYHSRAYTRQHVADVVVAEELRKVLVRLGGEAGADGSAKGAISPECLFLVIWKVVPRFRGYQQQDAHEFLRYMLDRLHTELLQVLGGLPGLPGLPARDGRDGKDGFYSAAHSASIVTAVFGGTLQSEVRCLACGADSVKLDPFLDLSLELPECARSDAPPHLAHCLASFVKVEELADTERYYCAACKCKQKSTKQFWIRRLPNVLCLHLKRFRWNNYFRTKVDTGVRFPLRALDMSQFVLRAPASPPPAPAPAHAAPAHDAPAPQPPHLYDLAAVIVHHGSGAGSGHYTAFAINSGQWFHFNDQSVRATDEQTVASCKPYIMFYIRRELALPPLPPYRA